MALVVTSEGPVRITKDTLRAAWKRRAKNQRLVIRDQECRGLALIVNAAAMSWVFSYKPRGTDPTTGRRFPTKSLTLGNPETMAPDEARIEANRAKENTKTGRDPAAERRARIKAAALDRASTVSRLAELYEKALPKRPKLRGGGLPSAAYVAAEMHHLRAAVATMKVDAVPVSELGAAELRRLLAAEAGRLAVARHRFGAVSRFLDWCHDEGLIPANPCALVGKAKRPKAPPPRSRHLLPDQAAALWKAAAGMAETVHRDFARFLIAVPCRRNEAARMEWDQVDLVAATWTQPARITKNGDPHRLHLHRLALELLRERHKAAKEPRAGLVFPAPRAAKPLTTFSAMNAELDRLSGLSGWAWHDLRRTFATALGEAGMSEAVADAILNHRQAATRGGVLGVYQLAQRWPEQRAAMEAWGNILAAAIGGGDDGGKVVELAPRRRAGIAAAG